MLPAARPLTSTPRGLLISAASTVTIAPVLFLLPGFEERLAAQAAKWGPRWSRGFARLTPRIESGLKKGVERSRIQSGVRVVEGPLRGWALAVDRNIKKVVPARK